MTHYARSWAAVFSSVVPEDPDRGYFKFCSERRGIVIYCQTTFKNFNFVPSGYCPRSAMPCLKEAEYAQGPE